MNNFVSRLGIAALASSMVAGAVLAGNSDVVRAAVSVSGPAPINPFIWERTIDQSGLSAGYTSGVTNFDSYIAGAPFHTRNNDPANYAASFEDPPQNVDFDLGLLTSINRIAFWNYPFLNSAGVNNFDILVASQADFSDAVNVGNFNADDNAVGSLTNAVQVFDVTNTVGRYVRMVVNSTYNANTAIGFSEIAFGTGVVPAPGALALLGMAGLVARRRRRA